MRKTLTLDGINIQIDVKETGQTPGKYQFSSRKYDVWCFDDTWEEAQEDLAWILRDKVKSYTTAAYSEMRDKRTRQLWKTYQQLLKMGLTVD